MGMPTMQGAKLSPRGRATARREKRAPGQPGGGGGGGTDAGSADGKLKQGKGKHKFDSSINKKQARRKMGRKQKQKQVESRNEYVDATGEEGEDEPKKKKKKKAKADAPPQKLTVRGLKPKLWETEKEKLQPFKRDVRGAPDDAAVPPMDDAEVDALRRSLHVRVPQQRTKVCRFWEQGSCSRGDACGFAHTHAASDSDGSGSSAARCPVPVQSLADPVLPKLIGRAMLHLGHPRPTPVQAQAWPAALAGHDLLCRAPTGTGKTLAYLLPAMAHAAAQRRKPKPGEGPAALVLVPTRELAMQVGGVADALRTLTGLRSVSLYGGAPRDEQVEALEQSVAIAVATTGRLLDLLVSKHAQMVRCSLLVLDEADLLISLGFEDQVTQIVGQLRPDRQTLLFSATFSERLEAAAGAWLQQPLRVYADDERGSARDAQGVGCGPDAEMGDGAADDDGEGAAGGPDGVSLPPSAVAQQFSLCGPGEKRERLADFLLSLTRDTEAAALGEGEGGGGGASWHRGKVRNRPRAMVFVNQIKDIKALVASLKKRGLATSSLHGEHSQRERETNLADFKAGKATVICATDLGGRGVDVRRLAAVVNYDAPASLQTYVHRAGRTGRQGHPGVVLTLLKRDDASRHFARGAARLLSAAGLPADASLAELEHAPTLALGFQGPQQPAAAAAAAAPEEPPLAAKAMSGDLMAFAASFAG